MTENLRSSCWLLRLMISLAISGAYVNAGDCAFAQITSDPIKPDTTLPDNSIVTRDPDGTTLNITGGTRYGSNLFHSFEQFSVLTGSQAYFNNAIEIQNIISRVTGVSASMIDGLIKANGSANLFFLNPNGIIFGSNAKLQINGSFIATTANRLKFADGALFSASPSQSTPLLTISVPIGLQFEGAAGGIGVEGSDLKVQPGKTLALVGGNVTLQGHEQADPKYPESNLAAPGGRIELGSVAGVGEVSLNQKNNDWVLGYTSVNNFGDIRLEHGAFVDVSGIREPKKDVYVDVSSGSASGDVQIQSNNLTLAQRSLIRADTKEAGGQVLVHTTRAVTLTEGSQITADVIPEGTGTGGNVTIETGQLSIQGDNSRIRTGTFGKGRGGELIVRASEFVELTGKIGNGFFTETQGAGDAGNLTITTRRLSSQNGGRVSTSTLGQGKGGNLTVTATDSVELIGANSSLVTQTQGAKDAGNLTINTTRLIVKDGATVSTSTSGPGKGGTLFVAANDLVELQGTNGEFPSSLLTRTNNLGKAGNLTIKTRQLIVGNGAQIISGSMGQGDAGDIEVNASDAVNIFGVGINGTASGLFSRTTKHGHGGNIIINTNAFRVADNGVVDARTLGDKNAIAGNITVNTNTLEAVNGGQILTNAFTGSMGNAGNITVNATNKVTISGSAPSKRLVRGINGDLVEDESANSGLFVRSKGSGSAGNIEVGSPLISLDKGGEITAETASGNGGNITLKDLDFLLLLNGNNRISATAGTNQQGGNGGNITINAPNGFIVAKPNENNDITANAYTGNGGGVYITAKSIFGIQNRKSNTPQSDITASSQFGLNGTVQINTPDIDPSSGLVNLPPVPVDTQLAQTCTAGSAVAQSSFTITGRGGLPPNPGEALNTDVVQVDLVTINPSNENRDRPYFTSKTTTPAPERIIEATALALNEKGEVVLTANLPTTTPHSPWLKPASCTAIRNS